MLLAPCQLALSRELHAKVTGSGRRSRGIRAPTAGEAAAPGRGSSTTDRLADCTAVCIICDGFVPNLQESDRAQGQVAVPDSRNWVHECS